MSIPQKCVSLFAGPDMIGSCDTPSKMLTSPTGDGVVLFGCGSDGDIYQMIPLQNFNFKWIQLKNKLKAKRFSFIAEYIDDSLVNCYRPTIPPPTTPWTGEVIPGELSEL